MTHCFVALPEDYEPVFLFDEHGNRDRQVLWGDWLRIDEENDGDPDWRAVLWAWEDLEKKRRLKVRREHTTDARPLEIVFVDVGQGDGAVLITPERDDSERIVVIDAGEGEHMREFLDARFSTYKRRMRFHAAVITHPDLDHYGGFASIFENGAITFDKLYHSGLVERPERDAWAKLGGKIKDSVSSREYLAALVVDDAAMRTLFGPPVKVGRYRYAGMVRAAIDGNLVGAFEMLSTRHGTSEEGGCWMPGFAPSDPRDYAIEIVGPIPELDAGGAPWLRRLGDAGKTKNGHSVLLRLHFGDFKVFFGGDLNFPAEQYLLTSLAGMAEWPRTTVEREELVARAAPFVRAEVMKTCHHGSSDVTDEFLEAVNPAAFVISSGDEEGHVHPRPDLLGRLGKFGRGASPVLLSTELQRSTREKEDAKLVEALTSDIARLAKTPSDALRDRIQKDVAALGRSNVDVDGAIYLKTDGKRLIAAFKKEQQAATDKWFYFEYAILNRRLILKPRN
ncbi:MAG: MBL fold metallo-hydrolase [Sphingomonadaceae bacterium]|nr:MBL fold metallo-hydrolase [Sphingomonadaceae bacterium]